jgi:hypothetical protein
MAVVDMDVFLVVGLSVGLFLGLELRWRGRPEPDVEGSPVEGGLFSPAFVRSRLAALAEELERLDRDPDAFAKAFHTIAARTAYEALLADAARLTERPPPPGATVLAAEAVGASHGIREVMEL